MGDDGSVLRIFEMLRMLHERGYEQLRIVPGMSPSGMHYRASITFASNTRPGHGALAISGKSLAPHSSADRDRPFGWTDAADADAGKLSNLFVERFPEIAKRGLAPDPAYAIWFGDEALSAAKRGAYPVAFADYDVSRADGLLATTKACGIPMPPLAIMT